MFQLCLLALTVKDTSPLSVKPRIQLKYYDEEATLTCESSKKPVWHFPGKTDKKYEVTGSYNGHSETILIKKLNISHNGYYFCGDGTRKASAEIYVGGK